MKKRAQGAEMIGLLVIIILLLVLGAIYIRFASQPKSQITEQTSKAVTSSNLLGAMMFYTLPNCGGKNLEDAIKECAKGNGPICEENSCDLIEREVENILKSTLTGELEGSKLIFVIEYPEGENILEIGETTCKNIIYAKDKPVNLFPGIARAKIGRCVS